MLQATLEAEGHVARIIESSGTKAAARKAIATAGLDAVRDALDTYREGGEFSSDADAAWLSLVLTDLRVRDDVWARMDPEHVQSHLRLWTDLTRRARPGYVAPAASLLAFTAWQSGNGALANVALDRAQSDNPDYTMAILFREIINSGAPPHMARLPMTPDEVAASYAEPEAEIDPDEARVADEADAGVATDS
jgi:hypothetical protein